MIHNHIQRPAAFSGISRPMWTTDDTSFMHLALEEAEASEKAGEVPIGAILVLDGRIVGRGRNLPA